MTEKPQHVPMENTEPACTTTCEEAGEKVDAFYQDKSLVLFALGADYVTDHEERSALLQKQKGTEQALAATAPTTSKDKSTPRPTAPPKPPPYPCGPKPSPAEAIAEVAKLVGPPVTPPTLPSAPDLRRMGPPGLEASAPAIDSSSAPIPPPPPPNFMGVYKEPEVAKATTTNASQAAKAAIADAALAVGPPKDSPKPAPPQPPQRDARRVHERGGFRNAPEATGPKGAKTHSSLPVPREEILAGSSAETAAADVATVDVTPTKSVCLKARSQCSTPASDAPIVGKNWVEHPPKDPEPCPAHFYLRERPEPQSAFSHNLGAMESCRCCTGKCAVCSGLCLDPTDDQWLVVQAKKEDAENASKAPAVRDPLCRGIIFQRPGDPSFQGVKNAVLRIQEQQRLTMRRRNARKKGGEPCGAPRSQTGGNGNGERGG